MQIPVLATLLAGAALTLSACQRNPDVEGGAQPMPEVAETSNMPTEVETLPSGDLPPDQTTPEQRAENEAAAAAAGLPPTPFTRTTFACDNDEEIEVRFFPEQGIAVLVRGGQNVELQQQPVASGFEYSNGQTTLRGKGSELTMTVGMMAPTTCTAETV
jgi:membrane-bound inhibitor of C-type lysozyme